MPNVLQEELQEAVAEPKQHTVLWTIVTVLLIIGFLGLLLFGLQLLNTPAH